MKQFILLFATLLCLGCLLPILCYQLSTSVAAQGAAATAQNEAENPAGQSAQTLSDWWGAQSSDNTADPAGQDSTNGTATAQGDTAGAAGSDPATSSESSTQTAATLAPVLLWDEGSGSVLTVSVRDYLIGAVASELAMTWPDEALKAQAIACHSYLLYCKEHADTAALEGAYLSVDPARRQGFMTDEVLQSYWGEAYTENYT
ncbi:MAG: SpoIID/LytB domain-containing protein, partial [Faecalibacterium sp.]